MQLPGACCWRAVSASLGPRAGVPAAAHASMPPPPAQPGGGLPKTASHGGQLATLMSQGSAGPGAPHLVALPALPPLPQVNKCYSWSRGPC